MPDDDRVATTLAGWSQITRAATIGPWEKLGLDDIRSQPAGRHVAEIWSQPAGRHVAETMNRKADAEFIVTARIAMPVLLAALEAALKLADEWEEGSFRLDVSTTVMDGCARELRAAITTALTGKETGDA